MRRIVSHIYAHGIPVVWDLAGGYQEPLSRLLDIHRNTMMAYVAEFV